MKTKNFAAPRRHKVVTITGFTQPSLFYFDAVDAVPGIPGCYGQRVFFRNPTLATIEVLNAYSMWNGPDKEHWDDNSIKGWEFTKDALQQLDQFIFVVSGEKNMCQSLFEKKAA